MRIVSSKPPLCLGLPTFLPIYLQAAWGGRKRWDGKWQDMLSFPASALWHSTTWSSTEQKVPLLVRDVVQGITALALCVSVSIAVIGCFKWLIDSSLIRSEMNFYYSAFRDLLWIKSLYVQSLGCLTLFGGKACCKPKQLSASWGRAAKPLLRPDGQRHCGEHLDSFLPGPTTFMWSRWYFTFKMREAKGFGQGVSESEGQCP